MPFVVAVPAPALGADACPAGFRCSKVDVPLDRTGGTSGTIALRVARHRASAGEGKPMLIGLTGGPGQEAIEFGPQFAAQLRRSLSRYQLVLLDQRGTGGSGALRCPTLQRAGEFPSLEEAVAAVGRCGAALGSRAGDFTTQDSVEDIDAVRAAVGAEKVALVGTSYGTHVIQRYLLAHPDRVDRVVLDSTVAPGGVDAFQRESYAASTRVLTALRRGAAEQTQRLVARLQARPVTGRVYDARGRAHRASLGSSGELFNLLVAGDTSPTLRTQFPAAVQAAAAGDGAPLLRLRALANAVGPEPASSISAGLYAATMCTDTSLPWAEDSSPDSRGPMFDAAVAALDPAALGPFDPAAARETSIAGACLRWPGVGRSPDAAPDAYAPVPALVLSGLSDVRTPVENARQVASRLPGATLVTVAGTGHDVLGSDFSGCAQRALDRFMAGRAVGQPCRGVSNPLDRAVAPFPRRIDDVRPAPGTKGHAGRALNAALVTFLDATGVVLTRVLQGTAARAGGLRGGAVAVTRSRGDVRMELDRYAFVPGLRVTAALRGATGTLRLAGAARGTVRLQRGRVVATIDGRRLVVRAPKRLGSRP